MNQHGSITGALWYSPMLIAHDYEKGGSGVLGYRKSWDNESFMGQSWGSHEKYHETWNTHNLPHDRMTHASWYSSWTTSQLCIIRALWYSPMPIARGDERKGAGVLGESAAPIRKSPRSLRDLAGKRALSARRLFFCGWWEYKLD
mgnify:CR=1 FL=1